MSDVQEHATNQDAGGSPAAAGAVANGAGFGDVLASIGVGTALRPLDLAAQPAAIRAAASGQDDPAMVALDAAAAWTSVQATLSSTIEAGRPIDLLPQEGQVVSAHVRRVVREVLDQRDDMGRALVVTALRQLAAGGQYLSDFEQACLFDFGNLSTGAGEVVTPRVLQAVRHDSMLAHDLDKANGVEASAARRRKKTTPRTRPPVSIVSELEHLRAQRADDPAQARERAREVLHAFPHDRIAHLVVGVLHDQLSMDDEALLEEWLQQGDEWVRSAANRLLRELPESRMMQRIAAMGAGLVHHQPATASRRARTTYTRPETTDGVVRDLGLDATTSGFESQIPAAIVTALPLEFWRAQVDAPLDEVILAGVSKPGATPHHIRAWIEVIASAWDADLARAVLPWATPDEARWLIRALEPAERAEVCRTWLRDRGVEAVGLLQTLDELPEALATELVALLPTWIEAGNAKQVVEAVGHLQRAAPVDLLPGLGDQVGQIAASLPASGIEHAAQLYERVRWMRWRHDLGVAVRESLQDPPQAPEPEPLSPNP